MKLARIVEDAFEMYCGQIYPEGLTDNQRAQVLKAFMAGVKITLITMRKASQVNDKTGCALMNSLEKSMVRYEEQIIIKE